MSQSHIVMVIALGLLALWGILWGVKEHLREARAARIQTEELLNVRAETVLATARANSEMAARVYDTAKLGDDAQQRLIELGALRAQQAMRISTTK
jgi:hypothetical protein